MGEEKLASSDPETKIEQMLRKIADMQESGGNAGQMPVLLKGLKDSLEDLLACLPMTKAAKLQEEVIPALHFVGQWQGELFLKRSDGQSYMAEMICALVKDDSGNPIFLLANFYNITDRKRAEEALLLDDDIDERIAPTILGIRFGCVRSWPTCSAMR